MGAVRLAAIRGDLTLTGDPLPEHIAWHSTRHLHASMLLASGRGLAAVQRPARPQQHPGFQRYLRAPDRERGT
jgi:hypothetical protein